VAICRPVAVSQTADDEILIQLEPKIAPKFHVIARTRGDPGKIDRSLAARQ